MLCGRVHLVEHCVSFASCQWPHTGEDKITMGEGPPPCPGRENVCLRVGSTPVNGLNALKRKEWSVLEEG